MECNVSKGYQRDIYIKRRDEKWGDNYLYGKESTAPDYFEIAKARVGE